MSNFQIGLAIAGGVVLVAVVAHSAWTSRKNKPRQAQDLPPVEPNLEPLLPMPRTSALDGSNSPPESAPLPAMGMPSPSAGLEAPERQPEALAPESERPTPASFVGTLSAAPPEPAGGTSTGGAVGAGTRRPGHSDVNRFRTRPNSL
jgi:hypothetical protein